MKFFTVLWAMAVAGLLSGCQIAMELRIAAHKETWQRLSELDQNRLRQGNVFAGDNEDMVSIALGPPDKVVPITNQDGQKQTVWIYHGVEFVGGDLGLDPDSVYHQEIKHTANSVIFHDGVVVFQIKKDIESAAEVAFVFLGTAESAARPTAASSDARLTQRVAFTPEQKVVTESMEARLDQLVALTPEQKVRARDIFEKANEELLAFSPDERSAKGRPIRIRIIVDIRAILTPEQQAKYDAAPQSLSGGPTKK
jgi:hypothetical protein